MKNSEQIFTIALGIEAPWSIDKISFNKDNSQLDILSFTGGFKFKMDDGQKYTAHDTISRTWQHLDFFQDKCYLHAKVPKVKQADGKIKTYPVPQCH